MKVRELMTSHICCVAPDMTIANASKLMSGADVGSLPVCSSEGLCGIITDRDIVTRGLSRGMDSTERVDKVMTKTVVSISPDADIKEAVRLMSVKQIRRLPVVDGRELVGMISVGDLARAGRPDTEVAKAEKGIAEDFNIIY